MQESREVFAVDFQFTKSALNFYIESARHTLPVANLPQFHACITAIERHRDCPSAETHQGMVEQYETLRWNEHLYTRAFTAVKEFYTGLASILARKPWTASEVSQCPMRASQAVRWYAARDRNAIGCKREIQIARLRSSDTTPPTRYFSTSRRVLTFTRSGFLWLASFSSTSKMSALADLFASRRATVSCSARR
jgi:hypothetical protein